MPTASPPPKDGGFTLVELLVSLALLVLMLTLINGAFGFGLRAWEMSDRLERSQTMEAFRSLLEQRLTEALPLMSSDERGVLRLAFAGGADRLQFVTPMPSRGGRPAGLYQATLTIAATRGGDSRQLALDLRPLVSAGRPSSLAAHEPALLPEVAGLAVRYYGPPEEGVGPQWVNEWLDRKALPQLVAITVEFAAGDGRRWPPMAAELRLGSAAR